jgi:hypothetical protein
MYIVMKRYTVSKARERLADVLDEAERGGAVLIERGNVQYEVRVRRRARSRPPARSVIETLDPAVAAGVWDWQWTAGGMRFRSRPRS